MIDTDKLLNEFKDIKTSSNINTIKCYKLIFSIEGFASNLASYIILPIIFFYIISVLIFLVKGFKFFENIIKTIQNRKKVEIIRPNRKLKRKRKIKKKIKINNPTKKIKKKKNNNDNKKNNFIHIIKTSDNNFDNSNSKIPDNSKSFGNSKFNEEKNCISSQTNNDMIKKCKFNDREINSLDFNEALIYDKRDFFQYYCSLLRLNHLVIFTFYTNNDYNSNIIKYCLFLFSFALFFTVNALFFTDTTMHKIFVDDGAFNINYQIPKIIYSTLISTFINCLVQFFCLTEKDIIDLKNEKDNIIIKSQKVLKCLKIKIILFFIISFGFLFMFWYYLSSFCAVFKNTQKHLIKDTLISFGVKLIYPFILYFLPGIFRIISLNNPKAYRNYMYKLSQLLQKI